MGLPVVPLPRDTVEVAGERVEVRGLSRSEVTRFAGLASDYDAAETFLLACGCDVTTEEANLWRDSVPASAVDPVVARIGQLSGLGEGASKSG